MNEHVTDTHALIWHLTGDLRLSETCRRIFEAADRGEGRIWIPGIVLVETVYLVEKARFPGELLERMLSLLDPPSLSYPVAPLDADLVRWITRVDRALVPDLPDRVVAATALKRGAPLLSKDSKIVAVPGLKVIW